jgi:hypothetical protein
VYVSWVLCIRHLGLGLLFLYFSLGTVDSLASAVWGVVAVTTPSHALGLHRQEARIRRGHAPANLDRRVKACGGGVLNVSWQSLSPLGAGTEPADLLDGPG